MKIVSLLFIVGMMMFCLHNTRAQGAFDDKKKRGPSHPIPVKANKVNRQSSLGRQSATSSVFSADRGFKLAGQNGGGSVVYSEESGLPIFITSSARQLSRTGSITDTRNACFNYLHELSTVLQLKGADIEQTFSIASVTTDQTKKSHVRMNQLYKGIPVYGHEVIVHLNEFGLGEAFNGKYQILPGNINTVPVINEIQMIQRIERHLATHSPISALPDQLMVANDKPVASLYVYFDKKISTYKLAYHVTIYSSVFHRWEYFVDAIRGGVLSFYESTCYADGPRTATAKDLNNVTQTVNTYQKGSTYYLLDTSRPMFKTSGSTLPDEPVGGILTVDMKNTFGDKTAVNHVTSSNNTWASAAAISAHFNAGIAYDYFRMKHNRNSIDGKGGTIFSIVNVVDPKTGKALDNAFWNGKAMHYGNGDVGFKPLAAATDVAGHEMTHGVVENSANLEYIGESGAINESMSDIFGSMMDPGDWLIGEDIVKVTAFPSGALRSMSDPHNGGTSLNDSGFQPKHMNERYTGKEDNEGVHINSGIANHAFYKYAQAITRDKAASVYYKALNDYLTKSSKFIDLRLAVIKAAGDLFGAGSNEVTQAGIAFDAVGIGSGQGGSYTETLPVNQGDEYLLLYNTDLTNTNTLLRSSVTGTGLQALTKTSFASKPSVTDDGSVAVFVAKDRTLKVLSTAPGSNPGEVALQTDPIWSNVVVSKDGNKIAAVTTLQDTSIYVYDFDSQQWGRFMLYNPTYSTGINSGGPIYADALEWDFNGEYLVYDAYNRIQNNDGEDIEYWDVNFIHVWDKAAKKFADGTVSKLFASLPAGVSIGNPSFSKTASNIIAFDYMFSNVETSTTEYSVLGCNIETNDVNTIAMNNTLGWPSFNKDDKRIAFSTLTNGNDQTKYVMLNNDKISSNGTSVLILDKTKWAVYMATGSRPTGGGGTPPPPVTGVFDPVRSVRITCYPNPASDNLVAEIGEQLAVGGTLELVNPLGISVMKWQPQQKAAMVDVSTLPNGFYVVRYSNGAKVGQCKVLKQ